MSDQIKLSVRNLHKSFGEKRILDGIDIDLKQGESLVVIGGSGSGKSVLLKSILGLIKPDSGSIKVDEQEITNLSNKEYNKLMTKFGFLFQGGALFDSLTILENITFGIAQTERLSKVRAREICNQRLASVGLEPSVADLFPAELSGGMQKRVALARAIAREPEIIFFDEPTTGLDPIMSNIINNLISKISKEHGISTITITHDMNSVRHIADRVAMLYKGKIVWCGSASELDHSGNPYIEQFTRGLEEGPIHIELQDH